MVSTPFPDFCSFRPTGAAHALSAIVLALKSAGRSTVTHIFRRITHLLCRRISQTSIARPQHQLYGVLGGLQILRRINVEQSARYGLLTARILIAVVFLLNGFGIIDQSIPARELAERGAPASLVPVIMLSGRALELIAGFTLALGILPRLSSIALFVFLVPATFVSHSFWLAAGTPAFQGQLINFCKNTAILGGLLFIAATPGQPRLWTKT